MLAYPAYALIQYPTAHLLYTNGRRGAWGVNLWQLLLIASSMLASIIDVEEHAWLLLILIMSGCREKEGER